MRINTLTSTLAINAAAVSMASGRAALKTVGDTEQDPTQHVETDETQTGGGDAPSTESGEQTEDEDEVAETYQPNLIVSDDLPEDIPEMRSPAAAIEWGFFDWPVNAHIFVPKALAQRARGALQGARTDKNGKPNGKKFQTFEVVSVPSALKRNPGAVKGDIEVWRRA